MKTIFKSIVVLTLLLGTLGSFASNHLRKENSLRFKEKLDRVTISNASGKIIFSAELSYNDKPENLLNFSVLENGIYTVVIDKDFEIDIEKIQVNHRIVTLLTENSHTLFKPVFRFDNSKLSISKITFNTANMTIKLYYDNELIYSEDVDSDKPIINRVFSIDTSKKGTYKAIVFTDKRVYKQKFKI